MPRQGKSLQSNSFNKQKKLILDAIAKYKNQKQRPSQERIVKELQNRYGAKEDEILENLRALVKNGDVLRVTCKGLVSYRDASQMWRPSIERTKDYRYFIKEALDNLSYDVGATAEEIEKYIKDKCGGRNIPASDFSVHMNTALKNMEAVNEVTKEDVFYRIAESAKEPSLKSRRHPKIKLEAKDKSLEPPTKRKKGSKPSHIRGSSRCIFSHKGQKGAVKQNTSCIPKVEKDASGPSDNNQNTNIKNFNPEVATWILIAVAKIKRQKQRPSEERIARELKSHGVTEEDVLKQLQLCVENGTLTRVIANGQTTYRDPSAVKKNTTNINEEIVDKILIAISKFKSQRQQVNEERIFNELHQRYGLPKEEVHQQLKFCVNSGKVLEILNKGAKTYKIPDENNKSPNVNVQKNTGNSKEEFCNSKCVTWILKAIAKFKDQKVKASEERICRELQNRHGLSKEQVSSMLKRSVRENKVLKIMKDGDVSYKNPLAVKNTAKDNQPLKYEKQILKAITKYRAQHQRTSEEKISHELEKFCGLTKAQACKELRDCVKHGRVLKVVFKGLVSYKDPKQAGFSKSACAKKANQKQAQASRKTTKIALHGSGKNNKRTSSSLINPCGCSGKKVCYSRTKNSTDRRPVNECKGYLQADDNSDHQQVKTDECSPFVVIPIPGTLVKLDEDDLACSEENVPTLEGEDLPVKMDTDSDSRPDQKINEDCERRPSRPVKQDPSFTVTCSSPLNCSVNCPSHHVGNRGRKVDNTGQKEWIAEEKIDCDSDDESSSSSSSSEDSGSDDEEEKIEEVKVSKFEHSPDNQACTPLNSETKGVGITGCRATFQREWRHSGEPLSDIEGSFKNADTDVPNIGNISPAFESKVGLSSYNNLGIYQEMDPVVDFPDTDSTALIKELCAEVFSIEVPGNPDFVPDED